MQTTNRRCYPLSCYGFFKVEKKKTHYRFTKIFHYLWSAFCFLALSILNIEICYGENFYSKFIHDAKLKLCIESTSVRTLEWRKFDWCLKLDQTADSIELSKKLFSDVKRYLTQSSKKVPKFRLIQFFKFDSYKWPTDFRPNLHPSDSIFTLCNRT